MLDASDAYTRALATSLRRDLVQCGVGVTVASRDKPLPLPWKSRHQSSLQSPGDRLVDAILRGDANVALHHNYRQFSASGATRFGMVDGPSKPRFQPFSAPKTRMLCFASGLSVLRPWPNSDMR